MRMLLSAAIAFVLCANVGFAEDKKKEDKKPEAKPEVKKPEDKKPEAKPEKKSEDKPEAKPEKKPETKKPAKPAKKKLTAVAGTVKKFDADTGALTLTVKKKKETEDKEIKLPAGVKVVVFEGGSKTESSGKDGLKAIKKGAKVAVFSDADGKIVSVTVGTPPPKAKK